LAKFGSDGYWPPELLKFANGDINQKIDGQKSDIFGLGIVALLLLNKKLNCRELTNLDFGARSI
jgi:serine/threonine protein kinase